MVAEIPMPLSRMRSDTVASRRSAVTTIVPFVSVYLAAFASTLATT